MSGAPKRTPRPLDFQIRGHVVPAAAGYHGLLVAPQSAGEALLHAFDHATAARSLIDNMSDMAALGEPVPYDALRGLATLLDHALVLIRALNESSSKTVREQSAEAAIK